MNRQLRYPEQERWDRLRYGLCIAVGAFAVSCSTLPGSSESQESAPVFESAAGCPDLPPLSEEANITQNEVSITATNPFTAPSSPTTPELDNNNPDSNTDEQASRITFNPSVFVEQRSGFREIANETSQLTGMQYVVESNGPLHFSADEMDQLVNMFFELRNTSTNEHIQSIASCAYERMVENSEFIGEVMRFRVPSDPRWYFRNGTYAVRMEQDDIQPGERFVARGITWPLIVSESVAVRTTFDRGPFTIELGPGSLAGGEEANVLIARHTTHELAHLIGSRILETSYGMMSNYILRFKHTMERDEAAAHVLTTELRRLNPGDPPTPFAYQ